MMSGRKIRMAMVGGGRGAFIGRIHRMGAVLDGEIALVSGAFSSDPDTSHQSGEDMYLDAARVHGSYQELLEAEAGRSADDRADFVSIVTPNDSHLPIARTALEAGFHVLCDKPATRNLEEALELREVVRSTGRLFGLTHTYLGYPLVTQARRLVASGNFGPIRKVFVEYPQGWLSQPGRRTGKNLAWKLDPERAGPGGAITDIGTHAHNLVEYVTGQRVTEVCAELATFTDTGTQDDDASALIRTSAGAKGTLVSSRICAGVENPFGIKVYGETGGIQWAQQEPNSLIVRSLDAPLQVLRAGTNAVGLDEEIQALFRTPAGHPEGYIEAFANLYLRFAEAIRHFDENGPGLQGSCVASIDDGVRGMAFVDAMIASNKNGGVWTNIAYADA